MTTQREINWHKSELAGSIILRPCGELSAVNYREFTDELVKYAMEQPRAVLVVVDGLLIRSEPLFTAFSSAWMRVSTWPGTPVLLVCAAAGERRRLRSSAVSRFVPVLESLGAALRAARDPRAYRRVNLEIAPTVLAGQQARRFISETCGAWDLPQVRVLALVVGNELVENAYRHARGSDDFRLRLELCNDVLTIAVYDSDPREAMLAEPGAEGAHVGGLHSISQLSVAWGCAPRRPVGKVVWAALATTDPARR
ncbi:ATP-binding protein [Nocardia brasiliensis]